MVPFGFGDPRRTQSAHVQGIREKRLMGFEPTTFCMAIRPVFEASGAANMAACRGFAAARQTARDQQCAWMCADMQRFGNFGAEVPEIARAGFIRLKGSTTSL
jgi:hypothetical protein